MNCQYSFWPEPSKDEVKITIFLVSSKHPCRKIREVQAVILKKGWTWAQFRGHRHLLGATAFYTLSSAKRAKVGYLTKLLNYPGLVRFQPELYYNAKNMLKSGVIE